MVRLENRFPPHKRDQHGGMKEHPKFDLTSNVLLLFDVHNTQSEPAPNPVARLLVSLTDPCNVESP